MVRKRTLDLERSLDRFLQTTLLALLASGYLALALSGELDRACLVAGALVLAARAAQLTGLVRFIVPERWASRATACYLLFVPADYLLISRDLIRTTVHVIVFAAAVKVLSARTGRDSALVGLIAFLEMLTAALGSTSVAFLLLLMLFWAAALAALASAEIRGAMRGRATVAGASAIGGRLIALSGVAGLGVLALSVALFLVLPRTARVALERLLPGTQRVSGFAPEFTLGQPGEIRPSGRPMLHVRFAAGEPRAGLHWRGTALAEFDGRRWYNSPRGGSVLRAGEGGYVQLVSDDQRRRPGLRSFYEVVLHGGSEYLFFAGLPENVRVSSDRLVRTPAGGVKLPFGQNGALHYVADSYLGAGAALDESPPPPLSPVERDLYLQLPDVDRRIPALARAITAGAGGDSTQAPSITAGAGGDAARARALESYLRTHFAYSLEPVESESADPLAGFLFQRKKGHCEYFASAMAVLLRELRIPSRVATGYLGGTANPLTGWLVVRGSDAHAWVEAWIPGQGWTTYDPTPAGEEWNASGGLWSRAGLYFDAAETLWQEWVVGYDLDWQLTLAFHVDQSRRLGAPWLERQWKRLAGAWRQAAQGGWRRGPARAAGAAAALLLAGLALVFRRRIAQALIGRRTGRGPGEPALAAHEAARLYRRMLAAMHKRGVEKAASQTAGEFAAGVGPSEAAALVAEFTAAYHALRYGQDPGQAARMALLLRQIEALPR
jgi:transglutaminase-like putative cysteine protease